MVQYAQIQKKAKLEEERFLAEKLKFSPCDWRELENVVLEEALQNLLEELVRHFKNSKNSKIFIYHALKKASRSKNHDLSIRNLCPEELSRVAFGTHHIFVW